MLFIRKILVLVLILVLIHSVAACGGGGGSAGAAPPANNPPDPAVLSVAVPNGPYSNVLIDCVLAETGNQSCTLDTLPLLGQEVSNPSIDDILTRTVISHAWMGTRFRQVLESMPADVLTLLKSVTAIMIDADIRPSNYTPLTGAIYFDPAYLWLTNAEKATVSKVPDYRSDFGRDLGFASLVRYVEGTEYAWGYFPLDGNESRSIDDIIEPFARVLFHELAHAIDVFPPPKIVNLDSTMTVREAAASSNGIHVSMQLDGFLPLNSQMWLDLARVLYAGENSTVAQRALTPQQVGIEFENDGANDDYAYSSIYEDTAMLFMEVMMKHHYGIDREIAYTDAPAAGEEQYCDSYIVRWGFRNRIGDPQVKSRAELVLQLLLDQADVSGYLVNLTVPKQMTNGLNWCTIQNLNAPPQKFSDKNSQLLGTSDAPRQRLRPDDRYPRH